MASIAVARANAILGSEQTLVVAERRNIPPSFRTASEVHVGPIPRQGVLNFIVQKLGRGDVPDPLVLKGAVFEGRLGELSAQNPRVLRFRDFVRDLVGHTIENLGQFILVLKGDEQRAGIVSLYAAPRLIRVAEELSRVVRMLSQLASAA